MGMKSFFKNTVLFIIYFFVIAEILIRVFHMSTDAPKTYKNERGNIKYYANQEGYWDGGSHKWYINSLGYPGKNLPASYDNLVKIVGDSYIQNFMNPDSCNQSEFLTKLRPEFNFMEVAMDGLNLLGYFEAVYETDSLPSKYTLMYVNTNDFLQSVQEIYKNNSNQLSVTTGNITFPSYKGSKFKDLLYNFKFFYYLYRKNLDLFQGDNVPLKKNSVKLKKDNLSRENIQMVSKLLLFLRENYETKNIVFILHPNTEDEIYKISLVHGFKVFRLKEPSDKNYQTKNHGHWNCYGNEEMAKQVSQFLENIYHGYD